MGPKLSCKPKGREIFFFQEWLFWIKLMHYSILFKILTRLIISEFWCKKCVNPKILSYLPHFGDTWRSNKSTSKNILYLQSSLGKKKTVLKLLYVHVDEQLMLPLASSLIRDNYDPSTLFRYFSVSGYSQQIPLFSLKLSLQARVCKVQKILQND